ncbi:uncharacterized protein TRUGW13939_02657 [Talaromyces rugulosus]|uniref:Uncharacterized protein n=1 Tax=Talaromyces rugulosus TaxID=121627 RepID=A0A7H8QQZ3_TALRU|nr:uncharacterized protein TRUGW13939_02657 [Talaromyces rugulosus]QKX55563.1 hypothetical protein TRUGW13939_02657 [Talaromyces rugulosus]
MADQKNKSSTTTAIPPRNVITTPGVIMTSGKSSSGDNASLFRSNFASSPGGATPTSASTSSSTSTTAAAFFSRTSSISPTSPSSTIQYDHETYLELLAGKSRSVEKTASQVYREERARKLSLRARDPAVLSGPIDLVDMGVFSTQGHVSEYLYGDGYAGKKHSNGSRR